MTTKCSIRTILLVFILSSCGYEHTQPTITSTPISSSTASAMKTVNKMTTEVFLPTAPIRLATITKTPLPPGYKPPIIKPTSSPTNGPQDAIVEWRLPERMYVYDTSFIDMERGWALFNDTFLFQTTDGGASWSQLPHIKQAFRDIEFVNDSLGWAIASDGLYKTEDGGQTWSRLLENLYPGLPVMEFIDEKNGFLYSAAGFTRTTDGGETWQVLHPDAFVDLTGDDWILDSLSFINAQEGWVLYMSCNMPLCRILLFKTEDGGETFQQVIAMNWMRPGHEIFFLDETHGWFFGSQSGFNWTEDGGKTWTSEGAGGARISHMQMLTERDGFAAGGDEMSDYNGIMRTHDGGKTWEPILPSLQPHRLVRFLDADHGFGMGGFHDPTALLATENGGGSWKKIGNLPKVVNQLQFLDQQTAYAGVPDYFENNQDYIWSTKDRGISWEEIGLPYNFRLHNFFFLTTEVGIAWDYENNILQTLDHGETWQQLDSNAFTVPLPKKHCGLLQIATDIYHACPGDIRWNPVIKMASVNRFIPVSATAAWIFGQKDISGPTELLRTTDRGKTWEPLKTGRISFRDLNFIDANQGWVVCYSSFLLRTIDGAKTWQQVLPAVITLE